MHLLRCLWFFSAYFGIKISACHIPGVQNTDANQLSRNRSTDFLKQNPHVSTIPETIPMPLLKHILPRKQNWTSSLFSATSNTLLTGSKCPHLPAHHMLCVHCF